LQKVAGDELGELTLTSPLSPGVTRQWKRLEDYSQEVALARIYAGFHYRFSTETAQVMGRKIGELTVRMQLLSAAGPKSGETIKVQGGGAAPGAFAFAARRPSPAEFVSGVSSATTEALSSTRTQGGTASGSQFMPPALPKGSAHKPVAPMA
jgi:hypothetical protein